MKIKSGDTERDVRLEKDPAGAQEVLEASREELARALEELRELARGIHPAVLTDRGLEAALESLASRAPLPVEIDGPRASLPAPVEAAGLNAGNSRVVDERRPIRNLRQPIVVDQAQFEVLCPEVQIGEVLVGDLVVRTNPKDLLEQTARLLHVARVQRRLGLVQEVRALIGRLSTMTVRPLRLFAPPGLGVVLPLAAHPGLDLTRREKAAENVSD